MDLTIAQLAERTGVAAGTLRMWEARYDFPRPHRLPSGHRRYDEADIETVQQVIGQRDDGLSLPAAIARVRRQQARLPASIFAGLRERRPDLQAVRLRKSAVLAVTHAIEDERLARAAGGAMVASFQRVSFYRQAEPRWRDLARGAEVAVALADFPAVAEPPDAPVEIPIEPDEPIAREWALISDAPECCGVIAAWELPGQADVPDRQRRFELLFSAEPEVVRVALEVAVELVGIRSPETAARIREAAAEPARPSGPELRAAGGLAQRMIGYLGAKISPAPVAVEH